MLLEILGVFFLSVFSLAYWVYRSNFRLKQLPVVPGPYCPIRGHAIGLPTKEDQIFSYFISKCRELANNNMKFGVLWFGPVSYIIAAHPDAAEVLLTSSTNITKSDDYNFMRPWVRDGLAFSTGRKWRRRRKMITPSFHYDILKDFLSVMNEQARVFTDVMGRLVANNEFIDIRQRLKRLSLDVICETAMGVKVNSQLEDENCEYIHLVEEMGIFIGKRIMNPLLASDFLFSMSTLGKKQQKVVEKMHKFTRDVIDAKLSSGQSETGGRRKAFLDMMVQAVDENGRKLTAEEIQEEVDTFMFAGHDTSALALTWAVYLLGRHPEAQEKLFDEINESFGGQLDCDVSLDQISTLEYLDLVVKEVLRLYPPGPGIGRKLDEDCVIDGQVIPKGSSLWLFIYYVQRHPDVWESPDSFIPERHTAENRVGSKRSNFAYVPFSAGPRNCVGQRFAVQEVKVVLVYLVRKFRMTSRDEEEGVRISGLLTMNPAHKLNIEFQQR